MITYTGTIQLKSVYSIFVQNNNIVPVPIRQMLQKSDTFVYWTVALNSEF